MTAPPVEARSLSSLTGIFANPPQYPRNPTHRALDSLVLYIVRVPGSKDVFLTPLKPPTKKSISVEAIESSLYYFHVSTPEDEVLRKSLEDVRQQGEGEDSQVRAIHRKPLSTPQPAEQSPSNPLERPAKEPPPCTSRVIEGVNGTTATDPVESSGHPPSEPSRGSSTISRKPVGPRPLTSTSKYSDTLLSSIGSGHVSAAQEMPIDSRKENLSPHARSSADFGPHWSGDRFACSGWNQAFSTVPALESKGAVRDFEPPPPLPARPSSSTPSHIVEQSFNVTIVRRDPTSGAQWNVGTLSRKPRASPAEGDCLKIEITTPGYQKFAKQTQFGTSMLRTTEQGLVVSNGDTNAERRISASSGLPPSSQHSLPSPFSSEVILSRPPASRRRKGSQNHNRSSSESLPASLPEPSPPLSPTPQSRLAFTSPWQGTCAFNTGIDGRSLKCRHHLPNSNSEQQRDTSAPVAELRFNLPWNALRSRDTNITTTSATRDRSKRPRSLAFLSEDAKNSFHKGMTRIKQEMRSSTPDQPPTHPPTKPTPRSDSNSTSDSDQDHSCRRPSSSSQSPPRLDLKLGQERAGGGRKGTSAKLGKLVLQDEGLKMADLVVTACMGIWWGVWDGSGGSTDSG